MMEKYETPEMDIIKIDIEDVILTSGDGGCSEETPYIPIPN